MSSRAWPARWTKRRWNRRGRRLPPPERPRGPVPATVQEIDRINRVFSDAFTDRYQRDGMSGVRVPLLNRAVWRFAIEDAADGAMVWHDKAGAVAAFNMVHRSGTEEI